MSIACLIFVHVGKTKNLNIACFIKDNLMRLHLPKNLVQNYIFLNATCVNKSLTSHVNL